MHFWFLLWPVTVPQAWTQKWYLLLPLCLWHLLVSGFHLLLWFSHVTLVCPAQTESLEFCALDLLPSWSCSLSHCARTEETWATWLMWHPRSGSPQTNGQGRTSLINYSINPSCSNSKLSKILKRLFFPFCPAFVLVISKLSNTHSFK